MSSLFVDHDIVDPFVCPDVSMWRFQGRQNPDLVLGGTRLSGHIRALDHEGRLSLKKVRDAIEGLVTNAGRIDRTILHQIGKELEGFHCSVTRQGGFAVLGEKSAAI